MLENIKYGNYTQYSGFGDLPIEYLKKLLTKLPIHFLPDNSVERLKVTLIERLLDNIIYVSNPQNADFGDLPSDGDVGLIAKR